MSAYHSHANLVENAKIKKMDFSVFVCQDMKEKFVTRVSFRHACKIRKFLHACAHVIVGQSRQGGVTPPDSIFWEGANLPTRRQTSNLSNKACCLNFTLKCKWITMQAFN